MAKRRADKDEGNGLSRCPYDGTQLDEQRFCLSGNGIPLGVPCPFVCPRCRGRLDWSGACFGCHGTATPADRATWTLPGARYDLYAEDGKPLGDGLHWVKTAQADRPVSSPEALRAGFEEVRRHLAPALKGGVE